jgi:hypothetical protein
MFLTTHWLKIAIISSLILAAIILLVVFLTNKRKEAIFDLVLLEDPEALCLDGSPGSYYISR